MHCICSGLWFRDNITANCVPGSWEVACKTTWPQNVWRQFVTCDRGAEGEVEVGSVAALGAQKRSDAADGFFIVNAEAAAAIVPWPLS